MDESRGLPVRRRFGSSLLARYEDADFIVKAKAGYTFYLALLAATVLVLCVFMLLRPFLHYYELYALGFLLEVAVLMACLIGRGRSAPALIAALAYATILAFYFLRTRVQSPAEFRGKELESLFFLAAFMALSGYLGVSLMGLVETFTGIARAEMEKNRSRIESFGAVPRSVREGMSVGDRLLAFVAESGDLVQGSERELVALRDDFARISGLMDAAREADAQIAGFVLKVQDRTRSHVEAIHETSAAIEQINATIDTVGSGTGAKRAKMDGLRNLTEKGAADMGLALAHAGDFGEGFSVVAYEIRALAEQTSSNAKEITRTLKEISVEIGQAQGINQTASDGFLAMKAGVGSVSEAMDGFFNAISEIRTGIAEISEAASGVRDASLDIESVLASFAKLSSGMEGLSAIGKENLGRIAAMESAVSSMDAEGASAERGIRIKMQPSLD
jgi:hypothetical protein